jgi:hypothetical protein
VHSTHEIDYFISLLKKHKIHCVFDVRSVPYSKYNSQWLQENLFNKNEADNSLLEFAYKFKSKEIGYSKDYKSKKELLEA